VDIVEIWNDWQARGFVQQTTTPDLGAWIAKERRLGPVKVYCGFDPTADSLHLGSLMPVIGLRRFREAGCFPIALVGGATGMIGDPSGKQSERTLLDSDALARNVAGLSEQMEPLLEGVAGKDFLMVDNADWFRPIGYIDFLRDVGKHFTVNTMIAKESVRARLEDRDQGISYTEFSYMLLQAYDFFHLYTTHGCKLQIGGSDQWGNITAGIDLIKRKADAADPQGCTFPLLMTAAGHKFGKSEAGALWLDPNRTHPYFLFKYLFDVADADAVRLLNLLTLLPSAEIAELARELAERPERRAPQRALARAVTTLVHGAAVAVGCAGLESAMHEDDVDAFERHADALGLLDPGRVAGGELPVLHKPATMFDGEGASVAELAVEMGLFKSKSEVRREVASGGGFHVAGERVTDAEMRLTRMLLANRRVVQFRKGKKNKRMLCVDVGR
jgi:tyrosyl-tRNA synthetase